MKRLLRISLDIFLNSFTAILVWFVVGILINKNLTNTFTLTYSMQCISATLISIFGTGATVCVYKDGEKNSSDNGIFYGTILSLILFGVTAIFARTYIQFMNMDIDVYLIFCRYSIIQIMLSTILQLVLTKLYYLEQNSKANKIVIIFNLLNLGSIIILSLITKNQVVITSITLIILSIYVLTILIKNIEKIDFKLNILHSIKYDSVMMIKCFLFFLIYFFGFSNSFSFGEEYVIAINFSTIVTDVQWDISNSIFTVAKIDIVKRKFDYKEHLKNANILIAILVSSVLILTFALFPIYEPNLKIIAIILGIHILNFVIVPFYFTKLTCFEIEWSSAKVTTIVIIAYIIRTFIAFYPTPYCIFIGQFISTLIEFFSISIISIKLKFKDFVKSKNLNIELGENLETSKSFEQKL